MKPFLCAALCSVATLGMSFQAPALAQQNGQDADASWLSIGDQAPPLYISEWLKGDAVDGFEEGQVYVVEFWATWCGPCIAGMPHVSELQQKYKDDVTVIGVNIWDDDGSHVPAWMEERGDELMDYTVALQEGEKMAKEWMEPAGENGIPSAFIIDRDATIAWIGHPMSMDEPLKQVVAGTWNTDKAAAAREEEKAEERRAQMEMQRFQERAGEALETFQNATKPEQRMRAVRTILDSDPPANYASYFMTQGYQIMAAGMKDQEGARSFFNEHKAMVWDNAQQLNAMSWQILTSPEFEDARDADLAMEVGLRAHELANGNDASIIDTVARAYLLKAIQLQTVAVEKSDASMRSDLEKTLESFQKAYEMDG